MRLAPIEPDVDEARDLLERELAKTVYTEAQPNLFDRLASAVWDWILGLLDGIEGGPPSLAWIVVAVVVIAGLVGLYVIYGAPRINRKSAVTGALFGDDDERDAAAIRRAAEAAARDARWDLAIEEMFRAIARGLAERAVVTPTPGMTASAFAAAAGAHFPDSAAGLAAAASDFDEVRYLDRTGSEEQWSRVVALEARVRSARPLFDAPVPA
ncbi:DUF4129 domain-containing protein [Marisediminicola sp. LYQ134]|uniref:DUF4129 domain-containing protein n=1 Tax=unclassified Marisediminicola TaxID=2618316 RepID=UPI003983983C